MFAGGGVASSFLELGLIDELRIILNPILLGSGTPLFKGSYGRVPLRLVDSRSFDTGAMVLLYEPQ